MSSDHNPWIMVKQGEQYGLRCHGWSHEIDLNAICTPFALADAIMHVVGKRWSNDSVLAGLARSLEDIFYSNVNIGERWDSKKVLDAYWTEHPPRSFESFDLASYKPEPVVGRVELKDEGDEALGMHGATQALLGSVKSEPEDGEQIQ